MSRSHQGVHDLVMQQLDSSTGSNNIDDDLSRISQRIINERSQRRH